MMLVRDGLILFGGGLVSYGSYLVHPTLAYFVIGGGLITIGLGMQRAERLK